MQQRLVFVKVCVEVEAGAKIPKEIKVLMHSGKIMKVRVVIPWIPARCFNCKLFGHDDRNCCKDGARPLEESKSVSSIECSKDAKQSVSVKTKVSVGYKDGARSLEE
ncbi:hypothetical protein PTKIN_Ptkin12aG0164700 [Pterospermum kingtungense]